MRCTDTGYPTQRPAHHWPGAWHERSKKTITVVSLLALALAGCQPLVVKPSHPSTWHRDYASHMSESQRAGIRRVAIAAGSAEPTVSVGGPDYGKQGDEVSKGMVQGMGAALSGGAEAGEGAGLYLLLLPVILPIAAGVGGIAGAAEANRRENNKEAADALMEAYNGQLPNTLLAREVESQLSGLPELDVFLADDPAAIATDPEPAADALLTVGVSAVSALARGSDGQLGLAVDAVLLRLPDHEVLYEDTYWFEDTRSMRAWTENNAEPWLEHLRQAKLRISERIIEDLFTQVELRHVLRPLPGADQEDSEGGRAASVTPKLAWELVLLGGDTHLPEPLDIDPAHVAWELQILRAGRTVYRRGGLAEPVHQVEEALEACADYRWSVRPVYQIGDAQRVGEWMTVSRPARESRVEVTPDFHSLRTPCGR